MQDFKKLRVWHLAQDVSLQVIQALPVRSVRRVPGLRGQAIRAATSVAANLAEGCGKATRSEFLRFVEIALASVNELESHLLLARDAAVLACDLHARLQAEMVVLRRMLISLMRTLQRRIAEEHDIATHPPSSARPPSRR